MKLKPHGNPVVPEPPQLLDQPVVQLSNPFAGQELADLLAADRELAAIPPDGVFGVGQGNPVRVAAVPGVLGRPHLLDGGLDGERRGDDVRQPRNKYARVQGCLQASPVLGQQADSGCLLLRACRWDSS